MNHDEHRIVLDTVNALTDNYVHIVQAGNLFVVVDPADAEPVIRKLEGREVSSLLVLITHDHGDHTGGCRALKQAFKCEVAGGPWLSVDRTVEDGDEVVCGALKFLALSVPGHTTDHLAYYEPALGVLFTGDTLFHAGCGRVLTGDMGGMWASLQKLRSLPDAVRVYCGHDYTIENLEFAVSIEPSNADIRARLASERVERATFSTIGLEKRTNPFFRADDPFLMQALGMRSHPPRDVFAELRRRKDAW